MIYDVNGKQLDFQSHFNGNMELDYAYDSTSNANYTILRIFQTKRDGTKQYPFIRYPGRMTVKNLINSEPWLVATNAGLGVSESQPIDGVAIQNGVVINEGPATYHAGAIPLTIDANGNLGTAAADATATSLVSNGIVSATCGFCPIVEDYIPNSSFPTVDHVTHFTENAQRTIIGQFRNGDYAIINCAGRNSENSDGWTLAEAQAVCVRLGLKFAYNLDGGTSTSTFLGKHFIYDYMTGTSRIVSSFIVFNGTDTYSVPSN